MKKRFLLVPVVIFVTLLSLSGCGDDTPITFDETGYPGLYVGNHNLDSVALKPLLGSGNDWDYLDSLTVTFGTDSTDGKLKAVSSLLNGKTIEIDLNATTNNVTPVFFGDIEILGTTIKNSKITSGTATWNSAKNIITTKLFVTVDFPIGTGYVTIPGLKLEGSFVKQ